MSVDTKSQVKIKFIYSEDDENLKVDDNALYAPVSLKRFGLSEIVNYLLVQQNKRTEASAVPFDFLINNEILSTSLEEYLTSKGLLNEVLLTLEYKKSTLPPLFLSSFNNDDWISSISIIKDENILHGNQYEPRILTGSYDGIVRTYDMSGKIEKQFAGHSAAVKSVKWISETRVVSAGNDRNIFLWKTKNSNAKDIHEEDDEIEEGKTIAILQSHNAPVVSLDVNLKENRILSGAYDNNVCVWSTNEKDMEAITIEHDKLFNNLTSTAAKKRRKLAISNEHTKRRSPLMTLEAHTQPVEAVLFSINDSTVGYSVSQDHSIKTWDLITGKNVNSSVTSYSLLSALELPNLVVAGSSARHIILHDPRESNNIVSKQLIGHTNFVVDLAKDPKSDFIFSSASHDGTSKVWDIRSDKSLYTLTREDNDTSSKIFAVDWHDKVGIVSGGEDKKLQINKGNDIAK